jgi:hypothetical protein
MIKTFELAVAKVAELPDAVQEQIGRELLERIATFDRLRTDVGIAAVDPGLGKDLQIETVIEAQDSLAQDALAQVPQGQDEPAAGADDIIRQIQEAYARTADGVGRPDQDEHAKDA